MMQKKLASKRVFQALVEAAGVDDCVSVRIGRTREHRCVVVVR
jgi:hypothetical protein